MRMRKKKHGLERLDLCREYIYTPCGEPLEDPAAQIFDKEGAPVYLEIGAGKGGFAVGMVKAHKDACYIALERVTDCVVLAAEHAREEGLSDRLRFTIDTADNLTRMLSPETVDRIFLNFSDPWSKKGYAKRRLTHRRYLAVYFSLLKPNGILRFKTDNVGLFDFTLEELKDIGVEPRIVTRDLHASEWNDGNIVTEYESAFSAKGVPINMLEIVRPDNVTLEIPDDLKADRKNYRSN
jgi:tRNA (guanine-N7-)-methyltransferase